MWHRIVIVVLLILLLFGPARQCDWMLSVREPPYTHEQFVAGFKSLTPDERKAYLLARVEDRRSKAVDF